VKTLPQIGGLFDPHLEGVLALKPSLVLVLPEFGDRVGYAQGLGLDIAVVDHRSVEGILESIVAVGRFCGIESRAEALANGLRARMETVERRFFAARRVRTLVVVGGGNEGQVLKSVFVSGKDGMYNDLVRIAGGENVVTGNTASIPTVSAEGLLALNPEVIIQVRDEVESRSVTSEDIKAAWGEMSLVAAVRRGHLYVESADFMTVPGPRFIEALERFAAILESVRSGDSPHDH
jgi:iron complex transport system substrate-binding protein